MKVRGPALVTGASRGLGRAVALELCRRGFPVVASMRDPGDGAGLAEVAAGCAGSLRVARLDVTRPETMEIPDGLQVLVNNAGVESEYQPVEHAEPAAWHRVFETNVFGLAELTRRALPALRASGEGVVCNVTSASLLFPMPLYSVYRASKAAVQALGESLAAELSGHGVRVIEVLPGPVETEMLAGSDRQPEAAEHEAYRAVSEWAWRGRRAAESGRTPAPEAARRIVDAILDATSALRVACDPVGDALLAAADATPHAARIRTALASLKS